MVFGPSKAGTSAARNDERGLPVEGMSDKIEGKLKETEGKLTDDELRGARAAPCCFP